MRKLTRRTVFGLGLPLYLAGCGKDDDALPPRADENTERTVELFSWWIAPSEADALEALIALHRRKYPNEKVFNAAIASGAEARTVLAQRLEANQPPDLYQENAYNMALVLGHNPGSLVPLSGLFEELGLLDAVVPEVIDDVTIDGEIYSMPVNIHRENAVHYNKQIFEDLELEIPTTLEELLIVCESLAAAGITPIATSHTGWIQRILFNSLASASMGAKAYRDYFLGKSQVDEQAMRGAIELLDKVLSNYVNESARDPEMGWTDAADLVLEGKAAMFIHGDWAKGYLTQVGWEPGVGFGVFGMPGASELFLYGVDVFALVVDGPDTEAAKHFLRTVASKEGQSAFNKLKGSSPVRLDADVDDLDVVGQATLADLKNAELRMLVRSRAEWDVAHEHFAAKGDKEALLQAYIDFPPAE
jgi:glucose/mannose transport system substrate-binding protein